MFMICFTNQQRGINSLQHHPEKYQTTSAVFSLTALRLCQQGRRCSGSIQKGALEKRLEYCQRCGPGG
ncbi:hypothetical protein AOXY_G28572 [Acipenser oxyrinchus oxyrinchus]|uniref:Uncharacterized protein n=1 Tax=Acipenser oxyrinchus oxyrinchus TaxID=40147 RepID=A0AAD8CN06_ACIOX|nr:hypothetical protein AOXY_G37463 [Acipenser oxyrinchus oxyrinchus]KAK1154582.1 hypothetical protein AOXY_G28559 [Acipenser oxyrinchus oxyrinchus]KAK1154589.1 hypothetical protein AOXY_G28572 [Acipenser oxyrinchus oxyrinchus]